MSQPGPIPKPELTCRGCQAPNDAVASECWLCQRADWRANSSVALTEYFPEFDKPSLGALALAVVATGLVLFAPGLGIPILVLVPAWAITDWRSRRQRGYDLRLTRSVKDVRTIPLVGNSLIIVAAVNSVLHFRIHDCKGNIVVDTDETKLRKHAGPIEDLTKQLEGLWPPHTLSENEKARLSSTVASIVGHTIQNEPMSPERKLPGSVTMVQLFMLVIAALVICLRGI